MNKWLNHTTFSTTYKAQCVDVAPTRLTGLMANGPLDVDHLAIQSVHDVVLQV